MPLPSSYLTSYKNVPAILDSVQKAQAPDRFTIKFLQDLGYPSSADRLIIKMLKTLGLLRESGEPTERYHEFLDPSRSGAVLAEGIAEAYADLFQINKRANTMTQPDVRAKMKTISKGEYSDDVLGKMANTFLAFAKHADFDAANPTARHESDGENAEVETQAPPAKRAASAPDTSRQRSQARMVYEINIHLPATRDPAVYDALFASLTKHLDL